MPEQIAAARVLVAKADVERKANIERVRRYPRTRWVNETDQHALWSFTVEHFVEMLDEIERSQALANELDSTNNTGVNQ
jgi:hypothetical protein